MFVGGEFCGDVGIDELEVRDGTSEDALEHMDQQRRLPREQELEDIVVLGIEALHRSTWRCLPPLTSTGKRTRCTDE